MQVISRTIIRLWNPKSCMEYPIGPVSSPYPMQLASMKCALLELVFLKPLSTETAMQNP